MARSTQQTVTNEDILENLQDLMQMTSDGFERLETRMEKMEHRQDQLERQYNELKRIVEGIANEQKAQSNDIKEILDRLLAIEKRLPHITEAELREMQDKLEKVVKWAQTIANKEGITLKI